MWCICPKLVAPCKGMKIARRLFWLQPAGNLDILRSEAPFPPFLVGFSQWLRNCKLTPAMQNIWWYPQPHLNFNHLGSYGCINIHIYMYMCVWCFVSLFACLLVCWLVGWLDSLCVFLFFFLSFFLSFFCYHVLCYFNCWFLTLSFSGWFKGNKHKRTAVRVSLCHRPILIWVCLKTVGPQHWRFPLLESSPKKGTLKKLDTPFEDRPTL